MAEPLKMNPEIRKLWTDALLSGLYKKGTGRLHSILARVRKGDSKDRWCCLGVLCDLYVRAGNELATERYADFGDEGVSYAGEVGLLPAEVRDWAGLDSPDPEVYDLRLSEHNDGDDYRHAGGRKFATIAAMINGTYEGRL